MGGRILLLGATGTIGRATVQALVRRGHHVVCFVRPRPGLQEWLAPAEVRVGDVLDRGSLTSAGLRGEAFDAVVSCLASRTGVPRDAWAIDHAAHRQLLEVMGAAGIPTLVLLSAICVQKPLLAFQKAKLAFERELIASGLRYCIVRPTAFFKSLSGQVRRVQQGRPYLLFGDGRLTACKPISDRDLADYLADCLERRERWNQVLPIGGPGPALTPRDQGEALFRLLGRSPRWRHVPVALIDGIVRALDLAGRVVPSLADKAELARIGRYYATESMLCLDPLSGRYDAERTPSTGSDLLVDFHADLISGRQSADLGAHAVF